MKTKLIIIISVCVLIFSGIFAYRALTSSSAIEKNKKNFSENIISAPKDKAINLSELTSFEWDTVYFFDPYISKNQIYKTIGFRWNGIKQQVSEGMMQILFVSKEKVVCYCEGYGINNGYFIDGRISDSSQRLQKDDNPMFVYDDEMSNKLGYIYLKYLD